MLSYVQSKRDHEDAFTLVELLVVILIIGVLAAIAIPAFLNQRKAAAGAVVKSDTKNIATQIESWKASNPTSPLTKTNIDAYATGKATTAAAVNPADASIPGSFVANAPAPAKEIAFDLADGRLSAAGEANTTDGTKYELYADDQQNFCILVWNDLQPAWNVRTVGSLYSSTKGGFGPTAEADPLCPSGVKHGGANGGGVGGDAAPAAPVQNPVGKARGIYSTMTFSDPGTPLAAGQNINRVTLHFGTDVSQMTFNDAFAMLDQTTVSLPNDRLTNHTPTGRNPVSDTEFAYTTQFPYTVVAADIDGNPANGELVRTSTGYKMTGMVLDVNYKADDGTTYRIDNFPASR